MAYYVTLVLTTLTLDACVRSTSQPSDRAPPVREAAGVGLALAVVSVPELEIGEPTRWRFDPSGQFMASPNQESTKCHVWLLGSGEYFGCYDGDEPSCPAWPATVSPCSDWLTPFTIINRFDSESAPTQTQLDTAPLHVELHGDVVRITDQDQPALVREFTCSKCVRYLAVASSPDGARLALAQDGPAAIELRALDTGAELGRLVLNAPVDAPLEHVALFWADNGLTAVVSRPIPESCFAARGSSSCPWDHVDLAIAPTVEVWHWKQLEEPPSFAFIDWSGLVGDTFDSPAAVDQIVIDPSQRWLFAAASNSRGTEESPLTMLWEHPLAAQSSGMAVTKLQPVGPLDTYEVAWVGGQPPIVATTIHSFEQGWDSWELSLRTLGPSFAERELRELAIFEAPPWKFEIDFVATSESTTHVAWHACWSDDDGNEDLDLDDVVIESDGRTVRSGRYCIRSAPLSLGCEPRGQTGTSEVILRCGQEWRLWHDADDEPRLLLASEHAELADSKSGFALLAADELVVFDSHGSERARLSDVSRLIPLTLGPLLDLCVVAGSETVTLIDLSSGVPVAVVPFVEPSAAAIDPDRQRLALTDGEQLAIFDLDGDAPVVRWSAGSVAGLAWRQDGRVLYTGHDWLGPERAWDRTTGAPAVDLDGDAAWLERLTPARVDPAWRWIVGPDAVTRSLDFVTLQIHAGDALTSRAHLQGSVTSFDDRRLRVVGHPELGVWPLEVFADVIGTSSLVEDFFEGRRLPTLVIDNAWIETLRSGRPTGWLTE